MKPKQHWYFRCLLTGVITTLCASGFAWLVWNQMEKFIHKKTSVTTDFAKSRSHKVPDIIFCSRRPFKDNATWQHYTTSADYESILRSPQVEYRGIAQDEFGGLDLNSNVTEWSNLDTIYNGRCKQFRYKDRLPTREYFNFATTHGPDDIIDIYFVYEGDEIFLLWQNLGLTSMTYTSLSASAIISLHPEESTLLDESKKSNNLCKGLDPKALTNCLKKTHEEQLEKYDCMPLQLKNLFMPHKRTCQSNQANISAAALTESSDILTYATDYCSIPCRTVKHKIANTPNYNLPGGPFYEDNGYLFFIYFPNDEVKVHDQYLIHDLASIVSAVGGGLGLFLGFSCFSMTSVAINTLLTHVIEKHNLHACNSQ